MNLYWGHRFISSFSILNYIILLAISQDDVFDFQHSTKGSATNKKTRVWKNQKQIIAAERLLPWKPDDVACKFC